MTKNMGKTDRIVRLTIAIVVAVLIAIQALNGAAAIILGILAVYLFITSLLSFCPLYKLIDISTLEKEEKQEKKEEKEEKK